MDVEDVQSAPETGKATTTVSEDALEKETRMSESEAAENTNAPTGPFDFDAAWAKTKNPFWFYLWEVNASMNATIADEKEREL